MSSKRSGAVELADRVADICYALAGWLTVVFGIGIAFVAISGFLASEPHLGNALLAIVLFAVGFVVASLGIFVNPGMRRRLNRRHSPSTFGRVRSVDRRVLRPDEDCDERCIACDFRVERGLVRRYREEYALAGLPVYTRSTDYNYYCLECATNEVLDESAARDGKRDGEHSRRPVDDPALERR